MVRVHTSRSVHAGNDYRDDYQVGHSQSHHVYASSIPNACWKAAGAAIVVGVTVLGVTATYLYANYSFMNNQWIIQTPMQSLLRISAVRDLLLLK